ncbi:MAG: hypothetical protein AB7S98_14950, partial [Burkholderiaceae bacterium]
MAEHELRDEHTDSPMQARPEPLPSSHEGSRDPDDASRALSEVQELLRRHNLVLDLAQRQRHGESDERHELVESL